MKTNLLERGATYEEVCEKFSWDIPEEYNIASDVCDRWADDPSRIALVYEDSKRAQHVYTYSDIRSHANKLANTLRSYGLAEQDVVTLLLAQDPECAISHVACWKAGMISGPCSVLFAGEAIKYRINDCKARVVITDLANYDKVNGIRSECPSLIKI